MTDLFAIILAAGTSTRMGRCKTELDWLDGKNLLTYQVEQWLQVNVHPLVIVGEHNQEQVKRHNPIVTSDQVRIIVNKQAALGKTTSILAGLNALDRHYQAVIISAIDQPRTSWVYQQLIDAHLQNQSWQSQGMITAPIYQGKIGHPLVFSQQVHSLLMGISEETKGLRQIIQQFYPQIHRVEFFTPDILLDINTPKKYEEARSIYLIT